MLDQVFSKELFFATLCSLLIYSVFIKFNFVIVKPTSEQMDNVEYHHDDDMNTN